MQSAHELARCLTRASNYVTKIELQKNLKCKASKRVKRHKKEEKNLKNFAKAKKNREKGQVQKSDCS